MKEQRKSLSVNKDWALFLDRDGVINRRIPGDYIKRWDEFEFLPGTLEAIARFSGIFGHIFVVTNQQGIGKGLMTIDSLNSLHQKMVEEIHTAGGHIDKIYFCPDLEKSGSLYRKPAIGMALQARKDFPGIKLNHSVVAGDSISDMKFGRSAGMTTCLIGEDIELARLHYELIDFRFNDLLNLAQTL
jgi:histidinol-phosphate phosphatase family protein